MVGSVINFPGHEMQLSVPSVEEYRPEGQGSHSIAPLALNLPAGHMPEQEALVRPATCPNRPAEHLVHAHKRGCTVEVVVDVSCLEMRNSAVPTLRDAGIPVFVYHSTGRSLCHHKFAVIDDDTWTGSMNWTYNGMTRNVCRLTALQCSLHSQHFKGDT